MKIKCVVCGAIIRFKLGKDTVIACSKCNTEFDRQKIEAAITRLSEPEDSDADSVEAVLDDEETHEAGHESVADTNDQSVTTDAPVEIPAIGVRKIDDDDLEPDDLAGLSATSAITVVRINQRRRKRTLLVVGLVVLCLGMSLAVYFVYQNNVSQELELSQQDPVVESPLDNPLEIEEESIERNKPTTDMPPVVDWDRVPFGLLDHAPLDQPPTQSKNWFKSKKTLKDCWFVVKPYLVELHAETPRGPRFATGIIIDSRGWVLTSYRQMLGASTIHIRRSRQSANDSAKPLQDKVRGYIAVEPSLDLAILSVNRRLIDALEDFSIIESDEVVQGSYVIQCQSPCAICPQSTVESRVIDKKNVDQFAELDVARLQRLEANPDVSWIYHRKSGLLSPGAALVDDKANLIGVNTAFRLGNKDDILAVPSPMIIDFKNSAFDEVKDLPVEGSEKFLATTPVVNAVDSGGAVASANADLVKKLNRLGSECESFGWKAETEPDDRVFTEFLSTFVQLTNVLAQEQADGSDAFEPLENQVAQWQTKMETALGVASDLSFDFQVAFNRKFGKLSRGGEPFVGFAYVKYAATEAPLIGLENPDEKEDSLVFEFKGTDVSVITNLNPDWRPAPPDSPWLIIGQPLGGKIRLRNRESKLEEIYMTKVITTMQSD